MDWISFAAGTGFTMIVLAIVVAVLELAERARWRREDRDEPDTPTLAGETFDLTIGDVLDGRQAEVI